MVLPILSVVRFFRSTSEKNEQQKEDKVPRLHKSRFLEMRD
jgi:hypothetical protein